MKISLSKNEIRILKIWADNNISGGHWGDGDVIFPDEDILLEKIKQLEKDGTTNFTSRNFDIALVWSEENNGTPEEEILIDKFKKLNKNSDL